MTCSNGNAVIRWGILFFFCSLSYETVEGTVTITDSTKDHTIVEKLQTLTLTCSAICTNSTCAYKWSSRNFKVRDTAGSRVTITNVPRGTHPYVFTCTVTDTGDQNTGTCIRNVEVYYAPNVKVTTSGNGANCTAVGNPSNFTFVSWLQTVEGVLVRNLTGNRFLTINSSYQYRGKYECVVRNGIKSYKNNLVDQNSSITIRREVKPQVLTSKDVKQKVSKGGNFSTIMKVYSDPQQVQVKVLKKEGNTSQVISYAENDKHIDLVSVKFFGKRIDVNGTHIRLNINRMKEDYFGFYTVTVWNDFGETNVSAHIIPQGPPDAPVYFEVSHISHESVIFYLTSGFYNGANQTLLIEYRTYNGSTWINGSTVDVGSQQNKTVRMEVIGLKPETTYTFRAYCFNIFNSSEAVEMVVVTAKEPTDWLVIGLGVGAVVIFIILVVVFVLLRIKFRGKKEKKPRMLPKVEVNDIFARDNKLTDSSEANENAHLRGAENEIYENTEKPSPSQGFNIRKQENNYANVAQLGASTFQPDLGRKKISISDDTAIYSNTNGMTDANQVCTQTATTEKHYINVKPVVDEDDYLDMDVTESISRSISLQPKNVKFTSKKGSVTTSFRDNNVRKNQIVRIVKKKEEPDVNPTEPSELYMDMESGKRESMPNYIAPPPPTQHTAEFTGHYVNLR